MHGLTSYQRDLLFIVAKNDGAKGKVVVEAMKEYYEGDVTTGTVYKHLDKLADKRMLIKMKEGRSRKYSLSKVGIRELRARQNWNTACLERHDSFDVDSEAMRASDTLTV
jgi:DNA-binding PadR family transcriptional regulator